MDGVTEYNPNLDKEELIRMAMEALDEDIDYESESLERMQDDVEFEAGINHWGDDLYNWRTSQNRPCLVVPRANAFLNQVRNEQRQNKASIKVVPRGASSRDIKDYRIKCAERRQGLIRGIQYDSKAVDAYQCAFDDAVGPGRGWWQVKTKYVNDRTNDQKIVILPIRDSWNVTPDRTRREFDYSDMNHCFYGNMISRKKFKKMYPDATEASWTSTGYDNKWLTADDIRVTQLYCKWVKTRELITFTNPERTKVFEEYRDELPKELLESDSFKASIKTKREVKTPYIMWYKLTRYDILEEKFVPGEYIPMVPVIGTEKEINGKADIQGMMRKLKDSARMYDFWNSHEAEIIAYAPKSRYIAAAGQTEPYNEYWANSNLQANAVLLYKPVEINGHLVPPPQLVPYPEVPQAAIVAKQGCVDDMRSITGMHEPSLGIKSNQSGRAILAEQRQGDNANYHFIDNLRIAITQTARIINPWLDIYYPPGTVARILGEDETESFVTIGDIDPKSKERVDLGDPDVDIAVTMGKSYNTMRQEALDSIMELVRAVPAIAPLIYDIFIGNMDFPGAKAIADRLKKTIPPELLEQEGGEQQMAQKLQQLFAQVQKDQQVIQILQKQLEEVTKELESKGPENRTKIAVAEINKQANIAVASIKAASEEMKETNKFRTQIFDNMTKTPEAT